MLSPNSHAHVLSTLYMTTKVSIYHVFLFITTVHKIIVQLLYIYLLFILTSAPSCTL